MSSVLDVGARGPAGARLEGNLAAVNSAAQGSKFRGHKQFCDRCYLFKSDSAYQERSSPEMEEIWEEGACEKDFPLHLRCCLGSRREGKSICWSTRRHGHQGQAGLGGVSSRAIQ